MKKLDLRRKTHVLREAFYSQLIISFKRALRIIGGESESTVDLEVPMKGVPNISLIHDEHQRINTQLFEMEMHKAEAIKFVRERTRLA